MLVRGARIIDPSQQLDAVQDLYLRDGVIVASGRDLGTPDDARVIDAAGLVLAPGLVDVHVHLREPGQEERETIATGAASAAAGGFTAICAMPNTDPVIDNQGAVGFVKAKGDAARFARVFPIGCVTVGQRGEQLAEFGEMVAAGAVAVSDDGHPIMSSQMMRAALEYARTFGIPVADHCEDMPLAAGGAMHEGIVSLRLGLKGIPAAAEEIHVARDCILAELTGGHVHLCHMSTRGSVELIRRAKEKGLRVTAEAAPHHFTLTHERVGQYDTNAKMNPPLREDADRDAIRQGLADGTLDCIATDHAPHHYDAKEREFDDAPNGIIGLETALSLGIRELVEGGVLTLPILIERMSCAPARLWNLPGGTLRQGGVADLVLFDPAATWTVAPERLHSKSRNTPWAGETLPGVVRMTVVGGRVVYEAGVVGR
ncbi:MAG: dihydroorotase [Gemmatimonadetes bacterium HGW-Gemmatimonadetes-1]|nr:MAG: dihydroorotase [Gemmatimonadetes bacterium HGW-Gemmatimonadetes-1]